MSSAYYDQHYSQYVNQVCQQNNQQNTETIDIHMLNQLLIRLNIPTVDTDIPSFDNIHSLHVCADVNESSEYQQLNQSMTALIESFNTFQCQHTYKDSQNVYNYDSDKIDMNDSIEFIKPIRQLRKSLRSTIRSVQQSNQCVDENFTEWNTQCAVDRPVVLSKRAKTNNENIVGRTVRSKPRVNKSKKTVTKSANSLQLTTYTHTIPISLSPAIKRKA